LNTGRELFEFNGLFLAARIEFNLTLESFIMINFNSSLEELHSVSDRLELAE
jgi:hypothetical protein